MQFRGRERSQLAVPLGIASAVAAVLLWEASAYLDWYNVKLFPPPTQILNALATMIASGVWFSDLRLSLFRYGVGFLFGNLIGITLGALTGRITTFKDLLNPLLNFLRSTPSIALVPLTIVWFGIGDIQKVFVVTWGVTFPVWLNTHAGLAEMECEYVWVAKSLGAKGFRIFREVYFPRALPFIIAGSRMGIATGFFALAAAEVIGTFGGVAFRIFFSHQNFHVDEMMVAILTIAALGLLFDWIFVKAVKLIVPWWKG